MATGGVKPKPAALRLVDGTNRTTRHGDAGEARIATEKAAHAFGKLQRPDFLEMYAVEAWEKYIVPAYWLDGSREAAAIAFCSLWNEFRLVPMSFAAAKHGQLRAYMSELGLTDERNRSAPEDSGADDIFD